MWVLAGKGSVVNPMLIIGLVGEVEAEGVSGLTVVVMAVSLPSAQAPSGPTLGCNINKFYSKHAPFIGGL
jgi:hypothetical protein